MTAGGAGNGPELDHEICGSVPQPWQSLARMSTHRTNDNYDRSYADLSKTYLKTLSRRSSAAPSLLPIEKRKPGTPLGSLLKALSDNKDTLKDHQSRLSDIAALERELNEHHSNLEEVFLFEGIVPHYRQHRGMTSAAPVMPNRRRLTNAIEWLTSLQQDIALHKNKYKYEPGFKGLYEFLLRMDKEWEAQVIFQTQFPLFFANAFAGAKQPTRNLAQQWGTHDSESGSSTSFLRAPLRAPVICHAIDVLRRRGLSQNAAAKFTAEALLVLFPLAWKRSTDEHKAVLRLYQHCKKSRNPR